MPHRQYLAIVLRQLAQGAFHGLGLLPLHGPRTRRGSVGDQPDAACAGWRLRRQRNLAAGVAFDSLQIVTVEVCDIVPQDSAQPSPQLASGMAVELRKISLR